MWYVIALVWAAFIAAIFWVYARRRQQSAADRSRRLDALMSDLKLNPESRASNPLAASRGPAPSAHGAPRFLPPAIKPRLLSPAESVAYDVFRAGLPDHEIFVKLRLADLIELQPSVPGSERDPQTRALAEQSLDLVICTKKLDTVAVVLLNPREASNVVRAANVRHVEDCLRAAGIRLLHLESTRLPRYDQVRALIYGKDHAG